MKSNDFARYLTEFLTTYLKGQKNVSKNTILSYRDTFKLLLRYCRDMKSLPRERITMATLSAELITKFLDGWKEKGNVAFQPEIRDWHQSILSSDMLSVKILLGSIIFRR